MWLASISKLIPVAFSAALNVTQPAPAVSLDVPAPRVQAVQPAPVRDPFGGGAGYSRPVYTEVAEVETQPAYGPDAQLLDCIRRHAEANNIDPLLVEIVIKHESAFDPNACSGVGASGLMQLMPETAADLGVTDLNDPEQNVAAGTRYLAEQLNHYGSVELALAAYNAGPGNVDYYGGIPPFEETQNYAASISSEYYERSAQVAQQ
jgi:soluble lytic murein transglycosylase-like protein